MNKDLVIIRRMNQGEEDIVCRLVRQTFAEFVASLCTQEGVKEFERYTAPELLAKRAQANHFILVAEAGTELIGAIEVRDPNHISLLFVTCEWQGQGIARRLFHRVLTIAKKHNRELTTVTVNSSPNAVEVYKALGFEAVGPEKLDCGIRFTPMCMQISEFDSG